MEGPTPVSALIHAATMVAAGVYLLARVFFLFWATPAVLGGIAWVGGCTCLFAASLALVENDLKRILAYSTLSQLGLMVMAMGLGGWTAGLTHLTTHAFFKALLFLGAGCVIHALHTNDIRQMGGLLKRMPVTSITFSIAAAALCGIFPLSGFWSKDEILALAFRTNPALWIVGTVAAGLTAFYMGRLWCVAFLNPAFKSVPGTVPVPGTAHEARPVMTVPLVALAVPSALAGFFGIPAYLHGASEGLRPYGPLGPEGHALGVHVEFNPTVAWVSSAAALAGLSLAFAVYARGFGRGTLLEASLVGELLRRKFYVDETYAWVNRNVQQRLAVILNLFERTVIIGLWVNGTAKVTGWAGSLVRLAQTGKVQTYALAFLAGLSILIWISSLTHQLINSSTVSRWAR